MTFSECLPLLLQGNKIRKPGWDKKSYLAFDFTNKLKPFCEFTTFRDGTVRVYNYVLTPGDLTGSFWELLK